jgi:hypothetical protein
VSGISGFIIFLCGLGGIRLIRGFFFQRPRDAIADLMNRPLKAETLNHFSGIEKVADVG